MAATDVGTGATITFQSGLFGEINDISWSGVSREAINTSNFSTTTPMTFIPAQLVDPGELQVEVNLDADADPFAVVGAAPETITLTFPTPAGDSSGATWAATGFCTGFEAGIPFEDKMTGTFTLKLSGAVTTVDAA